MELALRSWDTARQTKSPRQLVPFRPPSVPYELHGGKRWMDEEAHEADSLPLGARIPLGLTFEILQSNKV